MESIWNGIPLNSNKVELWTTAKQNHDDILSKTRISIFVKCMLLEILHCLQGGFRSLVLPDENW